MNTDERHKTAKEDLEAGWAEEEWNGYRISYDKTYLLNIISKLGIFDENTAEDIARAVACYTVKFGKKMNEIYEHLADIEGVCTNAVAMRLKRGLDRAENNGGLKFIDGIVSGVVYDYDYGYTAKEFIALLGSHMCDLDKVKIVKE